MVLNYFCQQFSAASSRLVILAENGLDPQHSPLHLTERITEGLLIRQVFQSVENDLVLNRLKYLPDAADSRCSMN